VQEKTKIELLEAPIRRGATGHNRDARILAALAAAIPHELVGTRHLLSPFLRHGFHPFLGDVS
jgi:hypothetical protein